MTVRALASNCLRLAVTAAEDAHMCVCVLRVCVLPCSWTKASGSSARHSGLSQGALLAAVIIPIIVVIVAAGIALAVVLRRRSKNAAGPHGKDVNDPGKGPSRLPLCLPGAQKGRRDSGDGASGSEKAGSGGMHIVAVKDGDLVERTPSNGSATAEATASGTELRRSSSASTSRSRAQSGFSDDIAQVSGSWMADGSELASV
jgi:hypothetical protein